MSTLRTSEEEGLFVTAPELATRGNAVGDALGDLRDDLADLGGGNSVAPVIEAAKQEAISTAAGDASAKAEAARQAAVAAAAADTATKVSVVKSEAISAATSAAQDAANAAVQAGLAGKASLRETVVRDANYQATVQDVQITVRTLSATRTVYLPNVDDYPVSQVLFVTDASGLCSEDTRIIIAAKPGSGDTIAGNAMLSLASPYAGRGFRRADTDLWVCA